MLKMKNKMILLFCLNFIIGILKSQDSEKKTVIDTKQVHSDFEALDRDGDGYLTAHDLRLSVPGIDENDITSFFDKYDGDRDGVLTFEEYLNIVTDTENNNNSDQNAQNNADPNPQY
jgi:hypothetical protein